MRFKKLEINGFKSFSEKTTFLIQDGDELEIFSINGKPRNTITISGAIKREGTYESGQSETILGVIKKAEGLLGNAYIERIDIIRKNPYQGEELIKVNLEEALKEPDKYDVAIQNLDEIIVYSIEEMDKLVRTVADANGYIEVLDQIFVDSDEGTQVGKTGQVNG